ncbi:MAG: hypothetical protein NVSMB6_08750 [Burkholderiaceae bacterium]
MVYKTFRAKRSCLPARVRGSLRTDLDIGIPASLATSIAVNLLRLRVRVAGDESRRLRYFFSGAL